MDSTKGNAMKPTVAILENIRKISRGNKAQTFTRLYRYLLRPDIYYLAYQNLHGGSLIAGTQHFAVVFEVGDGDDAWHGISSFPILLYPNLPTNSTPNLAAENMPLIFMRLAGERT